MTDQPPPAKPLSEETQKLKEALEPIPKELRKPFLEGIMSWRKDRAKLTDAEKVVFDRFAENPKVWMPPLSEEDRAMFVAEAKRVAQMSEEGREAFWACDDWMQQALDKAVPMVVESMRQAFTNPNNFKSGRLTEEQKNQLRKAGELIKASADDATIQVYLDLIQRILDFLRTEVEPLKSYAKIDGYLRTLLGDSYLSPLPLTIQGHLRARGIDRDLASLSFDELMEYMLLPEKDPWIDTVLPTLDMICEQRYGWPEGTARTKTISDLCLALEHAIEHNDPMKPSIWDMT
jgi:hypothetical protein